MSQADKLFTDGEAYERLMGRWSRLVGETFLDWLDLPNGLQWLDVGCGNGAFTEELIARCAPSTVMAIDPSDNQLAYARTRPFELPECCHLQQSGSTPNLERRDVSLVN